MEYDEEALGMINIFELNKKRDEKLLQKINIFRQVLRKCHHRIKKVAVEGSTYCFFIIPEYIPGVPKYNTVECAGYIVKKLKLNGFLIKYTYPNLLFITWEHVPSELKCPEVKEVKMEISTNPAADYNQLIQNITKRKNGLNPLYMEYKMISNIGGKSGSYTETGETPLRLLQDDTTSYRDIKDVRKYDNRY